MKRKKLIQIILFLVMSVSLSSCAKQEVESAIKGVMIESGLTEQIKEPVNYTYRDYEDLNFVDANVELVEGTFDSLSHNEIYEFLEDVENTFFDARMPDNKYHFSKVIITYKNDTYTVGDYSDFQKNGEDFEKINVEVKNSIIQPNVNSNSSNSIKSTVTEEKSSTPADYDENGNYKPVDEMTQAEIQAELEGMLEDALEGE